MLKFPAFGRRNVKRFLIKILGIVAAVVLLFWLGSNLYDKQYLLEGVNVIGQTKEWDTFDENNLIDRMSRRRKLIQRTCAKYGIAEKSMPVLFNWLNSAANKIKYPPTPAYSYFYFEKNYKVAYCPTYKAASTSWLTNLCNLHGIEDFELKNDRRQISEIARSLLPAIEFPKAKEASFRVITFLIREFK